MKKKHMIGVVMGIAVLLLIAMVGWSQREGYLDKNIIKSYIQQAKSKNNCGNIEQCLRNCYNSKNSNIMKRCINYCANLQNEQKMKCFELERATSTASDYTKLLKRIGYETKYQ